jgi:hypothetical protein
MLYRQEIGKARKKKRKKRRINEINEKNGNIREIDKLKLRTFF